MYTMITRKHLLYKHMPRRPSAPGHLWKQYLQYLTLALVIPIDADITQIFSKIHILWKAHYLLCIIRLITYSIFRDKYMCTLDSTSAPLPLSVVVSVAASDAQYTVFGQSTQYAHNIYV